MNIAELGVKSLELGELVSVIYEDRKYTNVEMDRNARKLGNALRELGVQKGDRVIVQMPNCPEIFQSFQAIWKIGAIVVPINYQVGPEDIAYIYRDSGAKVVITAPEYTDKVNVARAQSPNIENVIYTSEQPVPEGLSYYQLLKDSSDVLEIVETDDDDVASLVYTSGTTGKPKGVMQTHYAQYFNAKSTNDTIQYPNDTVNMAILPLCHSYGISTMILGFLRTEGCTVILRQFNVEKLFQAIEKYKVTSVAAVPTMYAYMLAFPDYKKYDLSSVKFWICGSAPLSVEIWKRFKERFGGEIAEGWGLTEACATDACNPVRGPMKVGSIGLPFKGVEMKVVDENGQEVPQGQEGEIILRGPVVMKGYWNQPEATAEVLRDGWLYTGDIGYVDEDGYFFITDRKKDLIIKGGENISPRAIEEVLYSHPAIAEAAVIGMEDEVYGEDIKAFVTLRPGETITSEDIIEFCRGKLKRFFVPKEVEIIDEMPKTLVGKILKKELRKR